MAERKRAGWAAADGTLVPGILGATRLADVSGYVGGHKSETLGSRRARRPELLITNAIKGMTPHPRLGRGQITKLKVYAGAEHPHAAQQPTPVGKVS